MANRKKRVEEAFQPKGEPKDGRKVSRPRVTEDDELSSAHKNEELRKKFSNPNNNKGGR